MCNKPHNVPLTLLQCRRISNRFGARQMNASNGLSTCSRLDHQRSRRRALVCFVYTQRKCRTLFAAISLSSCRCVSFCVVLLLFVTAASVASVACRPVLYFVKQSGRKQKARNRNYKHNTVSVALVWKRIPFLTSFARSLVTS